MIVLVPIAFLVPAVLVFLPPLMPLTPATLPRIVQFTTLVICLSAVPSVSLDCLVEFMVCMSDPALTSVEGLLPEGEALRRKAELLRKRLGEKRFSDSDHWPPLQLSPNMANLGCWRSPRGFCQLSGNWVSFSLLQSPPRVTHGKRVFNC